MMTINRRDFAKDGDIVSISIGQSLSGWYYVIRDSKTDGIDIEGYYSLKEVAEAKYRRVCSFYVEI
jgi:hypothetical protein